MKSGFAAFVGRPNTGKSTLLNALVGEKVAIVSDKPQTTRFKIRGIVTEERGQIVIVDTPGFHKPKDALGEVLNSHVVSVLNDVDAVCFFVDCAAGVGEGDRYLGRIVAQAAVPCVLVLNKIDGATPAQIAAAEEAAREACDVQAVVRTSGLTGAGLDDLKDAIFSLFPEGPLWYPADQAQDLPLEVRVSEIVREKVLERTFEEVPHAVAVGVESIEEKLEQNMLVIEAVIYVERPSQKGIVIGREGRMIKEIGTAARTELEHMFGKKIYLDLRVKVKEDWREKSAAIREFYEQR